jgi:hypothetical protein
MRSFDSPDIRRDDGKLVVRKTLREKIREETVRFQVFGLTAKRILERCFVVHLKRHDAVYAYGLEQSRQIAGCDRVSGFCLALFPGVAEERDHSRKIGRGGITQGAKEEEKAAELVVYGLLEVAMEGLDDIDVHSADALEGSRFVLTPLKITFFMSGEVKAELLGNPLAERAA